VHVAAGGHPDRRSGLSGAVHGYRVPIVTESESFERLLATMKKAAGALRGAELPFLLGGSLACWARGGPRTEHDVDFFVRPGHAEAALAALEGAGMTVERPPEHWLVKAYDEDVLVDLIYEPSGFAVDDEMFARADEVDVHSVRMLVASLEDVVATKLLALNEQTLHYGPLLEIARAVREQVDWKAVRATTRDSPYARAFFTLVEGLAIVPAGAGTAPSPNGSGTPATSDRERMPTRQPFSTTGSRRT
jgi:predicted nucleotidyltransferase